MTLQKTGQGATEYLVLLAVVLIIALVSIALLGFFPGMATDAQVTESEIYWKSAAPIAVVEAAANGEGSGSWSYPYIRVRNTGANRIVITKMLAGTNYITQVNTPSGLANISDLYALAPGEEKYFSSLTGGPTDYRLFYISSGSGYVNTWYMYGASSICSFNPPYGYLILPNFGFEYITYIEGQQIAKKQVGSKDLVIRCRKQGG